MPVVSSTRSSTTNSLPIVQSTPSTNTTTSLSSVLEVPKQSSSMSSSTTPLPSVAATLGGTHVVPIPSLSLPSSLSLPPSLNLPSSLSLPSSLNLPSSLSLPSSLLPTPSLNATPSLRTSMNSSATPTVVPCDTKISYSTCAEFQGQNLPSSAIGDSHPTTSYHSSSGKVVTTTHSTSTTTSVTSTLTSDGSNYMLTAYSNTSQTTTTTQLTTSPITSTANSPAMPHSALPSSSRVSGSLSSTSGYSSVPSSSVSQTPLIPSSPMGSDSTLIIGSSVGAAAVLCSMAVVALLLRSRWRRSNAHPHIDPFVDVDNDSTVPRAGTPSGDGIKANVASADVLGSLSEIADSPSGRGTPDSCATNSIVGVWPAEDRSAIARRTRSRELENIYPARHKCSGGTFTRKREKWKRSKKRGRREDRGVDGSEPRPQSRKRAASSSKSESSMGAMVRDCLTSRHWPMALSREWTNEVMAQIGNVKMGTGVVMSGRASLCSMEPSVRKGPSQTCSATASLNNASNDA
ncbi:hypothetical protein PISMIDRAFT_566730 [Pisolithus microcarpus 441]|uniref:Uncharacterized protein n=1 Tax=Pisolithus microcarpus 441 TaxID=765257 RepID=A0A0C9ZFA7_9AGAM|nr:hypothetical protein PISMIDRAFT_566730 [Pisolithus microcarpus 441]